jgi:putative transcriptional regulator
MAKTYRNEASSVVHEIAESLYDHGVIDKITMREFDESCLIPTSELTAEEIKALREREMVSQPVFARYLNVSKNLVSDWERGLKKPGGPALRLLAIVREKGLSGISSCPRGQTMLLAMTNPFGRTTKLSAADQVSAKAKASR